MRGNRGRPGAIAVSRGEASLVDRFLSICTPRTQLNQHRRDYLGLQDSAGITKSQGLLNASDTSFAFTRGSKGRRPQKARTCRKLCPRRRQVGKPGLKDTHNAGRLRPLEIIQVCTGLWEQDEGVVPFSQGLAGLCETVTEPHRRRPPQAALESGSSSRTQQEQQALPTTTLPPPQSSGGSQISP